MGSLFPFFPLMLFSAVVLLAPFLAMFEVYTRTKPYPGYGFWMAALLLFSSGSLLMGLRGFIPDFLSIVVSNLLLVAGIDALRHGVARFFDVPAGWKTSSFILFFFAVFQSVFTYVHDDMWARIILVSLTHGFLLLQILMIARKNLKRMFPGLHMSWLAGSLYGLLSLHAIRLALTFFLPWTPFVPPVKTVLGLTAFLMAPLSLTLFFSLISLHALRLYQDREDAWAEVRVLKGLLPICSSCKKIRNDTAAWESLETYITRHSEATFSHGLCPDCVRKFYPEMADED